MDLTLLFVDVDDFCKKYLMNAPKSLPCPGKFKRNRKFTLSQSEIMTIFITFQTSGYRNFKAFYLEYVCKFLTNQFPRLVSYNRFVELIPSILEPLSAYLISRLDKPTGISFIDSTAIKVCGPKRMTQNKVFKNVAQKAKTTIGWFFGFKLHIITNEVGGLLSAKITKGNVDDRSPVLDMVKNLFGKLFGDKGYISSDLHDNLLNKGIQLVTGIRKNMKNKLVPLIDKLLLRKRSIIETINDQLKNICQIEHTRHRSIINFAANLIAGLIAYTHFEKKPAIKGIQSLAPCF
ncbi:MAG: Transposase [Francisellaceae bacterium]|nr:Transposase [Francisellaceae bacterium]